VNSLDIVLLLIVVASVVTGFMAGFAKVGIGFAATIVGLLCGFWFYGIPAAWLHHYLRSPAVANILGFFCVFAACLLVGGVIGALLSKLFKWAGLSWLDRLMGGGFGLLRGAVLVVGVVTVITAFTPNPPPRVIVDSRVMPYASEAGTVFAALAPHELKYSFHQSLDLLRQIWAGHVKPPQHPERLKAVPL
jgi:membrane protein required for colicin V production